MVNKYSKDVLNDMSKRIQKFIKENQRLPNYVNSRTMAGEDVKLKRPTYAGLFEARNRFILRNGREPNYVSELTTANNPLILDYQDTTFTCGPASLAMGIQYLYGYTSEQKLRTLCKTVTGKGTAPADLISGASRAGYKLEEIPRTIAAVKNSIDVYSPVIAHIDTIKASCLGYSKKKNFGHWILIWDINSTQFKIADPIKGIRTVNANCIINSMYNRKIGFYKLSIQ